jgi:hypothetical protein
LYRVSGCLRCLHVNGLLTESLVGEYGNRREQGCTVARECPGVLDERCKSYPKGDTHMYLKVPSSCPNQAICVVLLGLHTIEVHVLRRERPSAQAPANRQAHGCSVAALVTASSGQLAAGYDSSSDREARSISHGWCRLSSIAIAQRHERRRSTVCGHMSLDRPTGKGVRDGGAGCSI